MTFYLLNITIFISYVDSVYPNELETEDTAVSFVSASYLDILLNFDINGKLTNQLYGKRGDFSFSIINFPYLCSNIPSSPAYGVYVSQFMQYMLELVLHMISFLGRLLTKKLCCCRGFNIHV